MCVLLPHLPTWTESRRRVAAAYRASELAEAVELPVETVGAESCYHLYVVRCLERDRLMERLAAGGIEARPYYTIPLQHQPGLRAFAPAGPLPGIESAAAQSLALPMGPALTEDQVAEVARGAREALALR